LRRAGNDLVGRLLRLDSTKETQKVHEHDTMRELGLVIKAIDFTTMWAGVAGAVLEELRRTRSVITVKELRTGVRFILSDDLRFTRLFPQ
jgi:hypothetical protein